MQHGFFQRFGSIGITGLLAFSGVSWGDSGAIERGEYLTTILGCGGCHTEGALLGTPSGPWLAGSSVGVAYANDADGFASGIAFPGNLTSDEETGLGKWSKQDIIHFLTTGERHLAPRAVPVMPWPNYGHLKAEDLAAIASYLKQVPAVQKPIPDRIEPGEDISEPYIRIGVYVYSPELPESKSTHTE